MTQNSHLHAKGGTTKPLNLKAKLSGKERTTDLKLYYVFLFQIEKVIVLKPSWNAMSMPQVSSNHVGWRIFTCVQITCYMD